MSDLVLEFVPAVPIPAHLTGDVRNKLGYVDERIESAEVAISGDQIRLWLNSPVTSADRQIIEEKAQRVVTAMAKGAMKPRVEVLEDFMDRPVPYSIDPTPVLLKNRELHREANGIYAFGPLLTRLVDYFEGHFLDLAVHFGAAPYRFPTLIPAKYLDRVNYFHAFPQSLTFVTHLREDLDVIDHFAEHATCDDHGNLTAPGDSYSNIQALLSPAVCYHLYFSLADRPLEGGQLAATAVGNCFRYESTNLVSLERLWNFTMREIIFVGSKDFVLNNREEARLWMAERLAQIGLAYRVESATDPFFIGEFRKQAAFQSAFQLKYEIRASLPFKNGSLAIGSYNFHQDFFGRHLNISLPDGSPAHTGCVAFGLERCAYAFLSQYGLDPKAWPQSVREAVS